MLEFKEFFDALKVFKKYEPFSLDIDFQHGCVWINLGRKMSSIDREAIRMLGWDGPYDVGNCLYRIYVNDEED